jgi:beta-1,4-mannosyl-glycoprotein beta-1,4-N-acetylglucosaminyltransferase
MKIYDGFILSSELDILELRLEFLYDHVDYFVLVESAQAISGIRKPLHYKNNEARFKKYQDKIIHIVAPDRPGFGPWDYEYFQRDYIKEGLKNCSDDDLVLISDVDEIVNLPLILKNHNPEQPVIIDLPIYSYFFNLKSNYTLAQNLLARYKYIRNVHLGCRLPDYHTRFKNVLSSRKLHTGWHFNNLFGLQTDKYTEKLKTYSHQEYNTPYYLNEKRINNCIRLGIDLFERGSLVLSFKDEKKELAELYPYIEKLNLQRYILDKKSRSSMNMKDFLLLTRKKYLPVFKFKLKKLFANIAMNPARKVWYLVKKRRPVLNSNTYE